MILAPQEEQEGQSEEEQLKQKTKERARKEFLGAVASEGNETCRRLSPVYHLNLRKLPKSKGVILNHKFIKGSLKALLK